MARDKVTEALLDGLRRALENPAEQRLYKSGKLEGLFPGRTGVNGEAAARALREGLLEVVRTELRGKTTCEWVRPTPRAVSFFHDHESPLRALQDLRDALQSSREAVPAWLADMRQQLRQTAEQLEHDAAAWLARLDALGRRVEEALAGLVRPALPEDLAASVPWGPSALDYLDRRQAAGASPCELPELFAALAETRPELSIVTFHDGLRRLHDHRALRLLAAEDDRALSRPEFALLDGSRVFYSVAI